MAESGGTREPRLHVVVVDHCARLGGAALSLASLGEDLASLGHRVTVVLAENGPLVRRLESSGVAVVVYDRLGVDPRVRAAGAAPRRRSARQWWQFVRDTRSLDPDVIILNSSRAVLTVGPVLRSTVRAPLLWAVRDIVSAPHFSPVTQRALRFAARHVVHQVVANSRSSLDSLRLRPSPRHRVVHPGVGPVPGRTDRDMARDTGRDTGCDVGPRHPGRTPTRIAVLGRLAPWKGQDVVLDAVAGMTRRDVTVDVIGSALFGEDAFARGLADRIVDLGLDDRVSLLGAVDDASALLADYDVLVHSAREPEAFGRVVAEGMTAGLAVVATRTGGPAEQITDGVDGVLVAPGDAAALSRALDALVADPDERHRLGGAASVGAVRFSRERQRDGWLAACRSQLGVTTQPGPRPTVSVVVPSYRRAESLHRTLTSLAALDPPPLEVLVVARPDDGPTRSVARSFGVRVATVRRPGLAAALEAGALEATGEVVAFTDDDAEQPPDWVGRISAAYAARPDLGAYGGRDRVVHSTDDRVDSRLVGRVEWFGRVSGLHHRGGGPAVETWHLKGVNFSVRREIMVAVGLGSRVFGAGSQHGNELFVCLAARRWGWTVVYDPSLRVLHHAEARDDGSARRDRTRAQVTDDVANRVAAALAFGTGVRRFTVPAYSALVGGRVWPGVLAGAVLAARGDRDAPGLVVAVLAGVVRGSRGAARGNLA